MVRTWAVTACVDGLIQWGTRQEVLLLRRNQEPFKGQWWLAGGMVRKGFSHQEELFRLLAAETGINSSYFEIRNCLGCFDTFDTAGPLGVRGGVHTLQPCYNVRFLNEKFAEDNVSHQNALSPTIEHSQYRVFKKEHPPSDLHPYIRTVIDLSGIFSK